MTEQSNSFMADTSRVIEKLMSRYGQDFQDLVANPACSAEEGGSLAVPPLVPALNYRIRWMICLMNYPRWCLTHHQRCQIYLGLS